MSKVSLMIMLIDTYSNFLYSIAGTADDILDDLALNNEAREEFQTRYSQEYIDDYNRRLKLKEEFDELEKAEERDAADGAFDSSILGDNFWNE